MVDDLVTLEVVDGAVNVIQKPTFKSSCFSLSPSTNPITPNGSKVPQETSKNTTTPTLHDIPAAPGGAVTPNVSTTKLPQNASSTTSTATPNVPTTVKAQPTATPTTPATPGAATPNVSTKITPQPQNGSNVIAPTDTSTTPATPAAATPNIPKTKTNISIPLTEILGPYPYPAPTGMKWVPNGWRLERSVTTFQEVFLNKVKPVGEKAPKKRAKIDFKAKVRKHINDSDFLEFQRDDGLF